MSSPLWRRDYRLIQQYSKERKEFHEEQARQARYNRLKRTWEEDDRDRDWSRTWSCKSKKELLQERRRQHTNDLLEKIRVAETEENNNLMSSGKTWNGALKHRDTTTNISKLTKAQVDKLQSNPCRPKEKRFKFDPAAWSQQTSISHSPSIETSTGEIPDSFESEDSLETSNFASNPTASVESERSSDFWSHNDYEDDGFYLSEEDLPALNGSAFAFSDDADVFYQRPEFDFEVGSRISIEDGEYIDIEDEKTGFLRVEYGPKVVQLLPTERVLPR